MKPMTKANFILTMIANRSSLLGVWMVESPDDEELLKRKACASFDREVLDLKYLEIIFSDGSVCDLRDSREEKRTCHDHGNGIFELRIDGVLSDGTKYTKHIYYAVK